MARGLKFRIQKEVGLYYPCSENKGADQLRGYREADLRLCFRICKKAGFLSTRLISCNMKICIDILDEIDSILTHISLSSFLCDISQQNTPRCDAAKRGDPSGAILFAYMIFIKK